MLLVRRNPAVESDIIQAALYIAADNEDAAIRFFVQVEDSISGLGFMPGKGSPKHLRGKGLNDVRTWHVANFPNYIILYDIRPTELYVLAVLDGRRRYVSLIRKRAKQ